MWDYRQQFEFPLQEDSFQKIQSANQLKSFLVKQGMKLQLKKQYFRIVQQKDKYIYARCQACQAKMKFMRKQDYYNLTYFNNHHTHELKNKSFQIQSFIKSMPINLTTESLMKVTTQAFQISNSKFYYHNKKLWSQKISLAAIFEQLDRLKHQTRYLPFPILSETLPDIFITCSPLMIANFKKYGQAQFMTFDVTYNLVKQIILQKNDKGQIIKQKKWGLGIFLAIPFGICLLNTQTKNDFYGIFKSFFQMVGGEPSSFITDEQPAIQSALKQLKLAGEFQGQHLFDTFHIIRNIAKKTNKKQLRNALRNAIFAKTEKSFKQYLQIARQYCVQESQIMMYKNFVNSASKYCLSQTAVCFHGIAISTSFGEKVNDFIKTYLPNQKPFKVIIKKLLKIMEALQSQSKTFKICKLQYQQMFQWRQLKMLRFLVCQLIYKSILKNYVDSLKLKFHQTGDSIWVIDGYQIIIINKRLQCSCKWRQKCGIPCSHLIRMIIEFHQDITNYINDRWKLQIHPHVQKTIKIPLGRPKSSRRNRV